MESFNFVLQYLSVFVYKTWITPRRLTTEVLDLFGYMLPANFPFKLVGVVRELIKTTVDSGTELAAHQYLI
ncbi:unnamed protein product [Schistosoma spindalis]|nr:unnamed protein product [Schistosoma spindale]